MIPAWRLVAAFCAAPLPSAFMKTWSILSPESTWSLQVLLMVGAALYIMQLFIGLPGHVLLEENGHHGRAAYLVLGFLVVALPMAALSLYFCVSRACLSDTFPDALALGLYGVPMGAVFWAVARPDRYALPRPVART